MNKMNNINPSAVSSDFKSGDRVTYVPSYKANEFIEMGTGAEHGVVKSTNELFVFVNYVRNGILQETAAATNPKDLLI